MKNKLLVSILSLLFVASGFSQSEKKVTEINASIKKNEKEKPSKKIVELRKKLAYYQDHSPFLKTKNATLKALRFIVFFDLIIS